MWLHDQVMEYMSLYTDAPLEEYTLGQQRTSTVTSRLAETQSKFQESFRPSPLGLLVARTAIELATSEALTENGLCEPPLAASPARERNECNTQTPTTHKTERESKERRAFVFSCQWILLCNFLQIRTRFLKCNQHDAIPQPMVLKQNN